MQGPSIPSRFDCEMAGLRCTRTADWMIKQDLSRYRTCYTPVMEGAMNSLSKTYLMCRTQCIPDTLPPRFDSVQTQSRHPGGGCVTEKPGSVGNCRVLLGSLLLHSLMDFVLISFCLLSLAWLTSKSKATLALFEFFVSGHMAAFRHLGLP